MAILSKEDILKAEDVKTKTINMPEWGGEVILSTLSGFARDRYEASILGKNGNINSVNIRAKLVAACLVDEAGKLLFSESDIVKLGNKSSNALDRIFQEAMSFNSIGEKEVEELAKN